MKIRQVNHPNIKKRGQIYYSDFRIGRKRFRLSLGTDCITKAKQKLKQFIAQVQDPQSSDLKLKAPTLSLIEWFEDYDKTHLVYQTEKSRKDVVRLFHSKIIPMLGAQTPINEISTAELVKLRSKCWGNTKPSSQNRAFAIVKHFFSEAKRRKLLEVDPAKDIPKLKSVSRPSITLSESDLKRLILASPEPLRTFIKVATFTGMRRGEIERLRWRNVSFDNESKFFWITLRNDDFFRTKNGRDRVIPIHERIEFVFSDFKSKPPHELIFKPPKGGKGFFPRREWRRIVKRLGFKGLTFHGLRRTFGTQLHRMGAPIGAVQALMGHSSIVQTRAYIDTLSSDLVSAISKFDSLHEGEKPNELLDGEFKKLGHTLGTN